MKKRILLIFLSAVMMLSNLATPIYAATNDDKRQVYLHAQENPDDTAPSGGNAFVGQDVNVYLAVDKPNKGDTKLNGYFVKLYYDSNYLTAKNVPDGYDLLNPHPLDYKVAEADGNYMVAPNAKEASVNNFIGPDTTETEIINGIKYNVISALVFFSGFEIETKENLSWHNILGVTFEAIKEGTTEVFIDTMDFDEEENGFELFAKHSVDGNKAFTTNIRNGGHYLLNIKGITKPAAPQINKPSGSYTPNDLTANTITITAETGCDIWYTTDPNAPDNLDINQIIEYGTDNFYKRVEGNEFVFPNPITNTTTLKAIATRKSNDGKTIRDSYAAKREYRIVPHSPALFVAHELTEDGEIKIEYDETGEIKTPARINPPYYNSPTAFNVCIDDGYDYDGSLTLPNEIYYTFSLADVNEVLNYDGNEDANIGWVKIQANDMKYPITITETCNIRIVTKRGEELSGVTEYLLSISPAPAVVTDDYMKEENVSSPVNVKLKTETQGADIFYTLDGSDPRIQGGSRTLYKTGDEIPVQKSLVLTTVAYYDGVYSELKTYTYKLALPGSLWVDASHQSGDYYGELEIYLISADLEDEIYFTTDGSEPTDQSNKYDKTKPIKITEDVCIKAVAKDDETGKYSEVKTFFYYIRPEAPVFSPQTTQFSESGEVHIASKYNDEEVYQLWITTEEGKDPRIEPEFKVSPNHYTIANIDEYTVIKAVVAKIDGTKTIFSDLVMHTYDVVTARPAKPTPTLLPGTYILTPDGKGFSTMFNEPGNGIKIYYTVSSSIESPYPPNDPVGEDCLWDEKTPVEITGETIIKAVAEDDFGRRSQIGLYYYKVVPEAPTAPKSSTFSEIEYIPVTVVSGSEVKYTINGVTHIIPADKVTDTQFYINPINGCAYDDRELKNQIDNGQAHSVDINEITLELSCNKDGVDSSKAIYNYKIDDIIAPPFVVNYTTGTYPKVTHGENGAYINVKLDTLEKGGVIEYLLGAENINDSSQWIEYDSSKGIDIKENTELHARVRKGDRVSGMILETYNFVPLPPVIDEESGTYGSNHKVTIGFDEEGNYETSGNNYVIYYSINGELQNEGYPIRTEEKKREISVPNSATVKAWVVETDSKTGEYISESDHTIKDYNIVDTPASQGKVKFVTPFDGRNRFATWELKNIPGIKLEDATNQFAIRYQYRYQSYEDDKWYPDKDKYTDSMIYSNIPIGVSPTMKQITVNAWLVERTGDLTTPVPDSGIEDTFVFVELGKPKSTLAEGSYTSSQATTLTHPEGYDSTQHPYRWIYYSTNSSATTPNFVDYTKYTEGTSITISSNTTIKTAYYDACGNCDDCNRGAYELCKDGIWGEVGEFKYYITKSGGGSSGGSSGGGGGGGSTTTKKKYTIDHFGNEHPHHTNYLYGYPDGSVKGDGNITREETAAILYRVYHIDYVEPHPAQGDMYPDVTADMWSAASIEYLSDVGLIMGYPDGTYQPRNQITRAEFVAMITRWLKLDTNVKLTSKDTKFSDLEESHWAYNEIYALSKAGYIMGYEDGTFKPQQSITRAEAVTIINRILGRKPDRSYLQKSDFNPYTDLHGDEWYYEQILEATINHYYDLKDTENPWHLQIND